MSVATAHVYHAVVEHQRFTPVGYRFRYRLCYLLLDIDHIGQTAARLRFFSHNRRNLFSLHDRDHGPRDGSSLRTWIEAVMAGQGLDIRGGRVRLLCLPRMLGFAFNPISVWFCDYADGRPAGVLCAVRNTFGEHHNYLLPGAPDGSEISKKKAFHVSPFMGMTGEYRFRVTRPGARLGLHINEFTANGRELCATLRGTRGTLSDATLVRVLMAMPLMTFKVVAMIHWQALKLWLRRVPVHRKPPPPEQETS